MKQTHTIKTNHPIVEFIRDEIINNTYNDYYKDNGFAICVPLTISNRAICSCDIYNFKFNGNNWNVPCINIGVYYNVKPDIDTNNIPHFINNKDNDGFKYYQISSTCSIKLKTFLDKNPQWLDTFNEWAIPVKEKKIKCRYNNHNNKDRKVSILCPDNETEYIVNFPSLETDDKNILTWIKPIEDRLTKQYYDTIKFNKKNNIKLNLNVWLNHIWYYYDYKDGVVEIYNIKNYKGDSIYKQLLDTGLINLYNNIPESTKILIKKEIESGDILVKDIILVEYREYSNKIEIGNI
jgi:hypothetical protein